MWKILITIKNLHIFASVMYKYAMLKTRTRRLLEIRKLISTGNIGTQEELLQKLERKGFKYTQATLSRDLKFLKVGRKADPKKGMVYVLPEETEENEAALEEVRGKSGFLSLEFSHNLGVIKTIPGFASGLAYLIDHHHPYEILATIAGDDTILVIGREGVKKSDIQKALELIIPEIERKP